MRITSSTGDGKKVRGPAGRRSPVYLAAATLARGADAGAPVGLALLATSSSAGPAAGGAARGRADRAAPARPVGRAAARYRARRPLGARRRVRGLWPALAAGALCSAAPPLALAGVAVVLAGVCGPLLTGGMSSRLAATAGEGREGWDALSYGLGGTGGPALVALATAVTTPLTAVLALSAATGLAAVLTRTLPHVAPPPANRTLRRRARRCAC